MIIQEDFEISIKEENFFKLLEVLRKTSEKLPKNRKSYIYFGKKIGLNKPHWHNHDFTWITKSEDMMSFEVISYENDTNITKVILRGTEKGINEMKKLIPFKVEFEN